MNDSTKHDPDAGFEPAYPAPPQACDAHFHVFGPADRYPHSGVNEKLRYAPPLAPDKPRVSNPVERQMGLLKAAFEQDGH